MWDLVRSKRNRSWSWLIIDQNEETDEEFITLENITTQEVTPIIACDVVFNAFDVSDIWEEGWAVLLFDSIQDPEFRVYPEFHKEQVDPLALEHFSQFETDQLITVSLINFRIGSVTPLIAEDTV